MSDVFACVERVIVRKTGLSARFNAILAARYDRMIVQEFDRAFPGVRATPIRRGGSLAGRFDLGSPHPPITGKSKISHANNDH